MSNHQGGQNRESSYQTNSISGASSWKNKNQKIEEKCHDKCSIQVTNNKTNVRRGNKDVETKHLGQARKSKKKTIISQVGINHT